LHHKIDLVKKKAGSRSQNIVSAGLARPPRVPNPGKILIAKILDLKIFKTNILDVDSGPLAKLDCIQIGLRRFAVRTRLDVTSGVWKMMAGATLPLKSW
jgi:hypothetical protein